MPMKTTLILLAFAALASTSDPADARSDEGAGLLHPGQSGVLEDRRPSSRITQSNGMSLSQATASVRRRTKGKIISAETRVQGGREVHYIKVLKDGKVKTHKVNGRRR
jgi:uncharacterized membrane protein YkoI